MPSLSHVLCIRHLCIIHYMLNTLNNQNPSIKLKATTHPSSVDFLDTTTFKGPLFLTHLHLDVRVFFKDTDTHALLHKSSFHPKHTFAGLIKSQLLRFQRICTGQEDFREATKVLFTTLTSRGYSRTFLRACFRVFQLTKPIPVSTAIPFVTTFSQSTVALVKHIRNNLINTISEQQPPLDLRMIAAYRKENENLQDRLVKSQLKKHILQTASQSVLQSKANCFLFCHRAFPSTQPFTS